MDGTPWHDFIGPNLRNQTQISSRRQSHNCTHLTHKSGRQNEMAFRKRNIGIGRQPASPASPATAEVPTPIEQLPGVRPSPLTSHPVTSTGAPSIDGLLGGHSGLALGSSLLVGEHDTTDFAGALLRYYAAEGLLQGHVVHIVGVGEGWVRELPGLADARYMRKQEQEKITDTDKAAQDRMKIAWRYERLGQTGGDRGALAASRSLEVPPIHVHLHIGASLLYQH